MTFFFFGLVAISSNEGLVGVVGGGGQYEGGLKINVLTILCIWMECSGRKSYTFNDVFVRI